MTGRVVLIIFALILASEYSHGQPSTVALPPARGHYKQLASFSPLPASQNLEIDRQKFVTDAATIDRRLSLTPVYLVNVKLDDFNIPDVPANSSDQTKADIKYLLALQRSRTAEDVRASLHMAN